MLHYAVVFFVIALIAAVLGFGGIAAGAAGIAKILFFVFLVMAVVTFVSGLMRGKRWKPFNKEFSMSKTIPTQTPVADQAVQVISEQAAGLQRALDDAGSLARQGIDKARQAGQTVREQVGRASDSTVSYIKEEPVKSVLIAAAAGAAVAALVSWLSSKRS